MTDTSRYESRLAEPIEPELLALMEDYLDEKSAETIIKEAEHADEPALRTALLRAWTDTKKHVDKSELRAALREKDAAKAALALARGQLGTRTRQAMDARVSGAFLRGAQAGTRPLRERGVQVRAPMIFNMSRMNPLAARWARSRSGELVQTDNATRRRIQAIIESALAEEGLTVDDVSDLLVEFLGLDERRMDILMREALDLYQASRTARETGELGASAMDSLISLAERMLIARAETVARTEILMATNAGQQAVWEQAVKDNLLGDDMKKIWIATADCCPFCEQLSLEDPIDIDDEFESDGDSVMFPPLHPNCRCTAGLTSTRQQ